MDVKTTFLNGDLEEEIYMEQPEGWVVPGKEGYVCLLKKAIYGLKQASRQWNVKIHQSLLDLGFTRTYSDAGVYVYRQQRGNSITIVVLYVDDLLLFGDDKNHIKTVKRTLSRQYKMTDLGAEEYIQSVLERFQMADCNPSNTPLPSGAVLVSYDGTASDADRKRYQSLIGSLMYAMLGTRPDISFAVTHLSRYLSNPSPDHWNYALYILRYLQGTKSFKIHYKGASNDGLVAYLDSDWAEDKDDRHSTSGMLFLMAGGAISWVSRRQPTISHSSTEAEYKAASDTCCQMAWLRTFSTELGYDMDFPTAPLFVERRTKHVEVWYHFIREFYAAGHVDIFHVASADELADALTKNVPFAGIEKFCDGVGLGA
ncbi:hypothetical protein GSI_14885 [Ganoderma sinense ZZ0214-1]|uniref:Reverse transcriptase Ty1/copia-type domain-containing protein n=1 Tax=Ganoderma sinense ZZ0214-1 TaxID=1077348 RepID=A0A2G8RPZ2_9APHY|nr:hypothetical protein GSI_14885 [Ganoderma sinense ZZ0214-1]